MSRRMQVMTVLLGLVFLLGPSLTGQESDLEKAHQKFFKKHGPAVVGVIGGGVKGSGVIIHTQGLVLTSSTAMNSSMEAYVLLDNHRKIKGTVVELDKKNEVAILQLNRRPGEEFPCVEIGDSDAAKVGQTVYVLGDSFNSIFNDGQVAMSVGTLSGMYEITENENRDTTYLGKAMETTAAVNANQNGAPLLDAQGRLVGMVTLNFRRSRFAGLAIPVRALKPAIQKATERLTATSFADPTLGIEYEEKEGKILIVRVDPKGLGVKNGLKEKDYIHYLNGQAVREARAMDQMMKQLATQVAEIKLGIHRDGKDREIVIPLRAEKKF